MSQKTDNNWLYAGLAVLLPEMVCLQAEFCAHRLPRKVRNARCVVIAVDSRMLFRGEWNAFNALHVLGPDATVVWLTREGTGRVFPAESRGERIVPQQQDIVSLRLALRRACSGKSHEVEKRGLQATI